MTKVSQLLRVAHTPDQKVQTVSAGLTILEAVRVARQKNIGALPVLDGEGLAGIISERDFAFKVLAEDISPSTVYVADFMTKKPDYVDPFTDLLDCLNLMRDLNVRHMPVMDGGKLVGIVSMRDVLYLMLKNQELLAQQFENYILGIR